MILCLVIENHLNDAGHATPMVLAEIGAASNPNSEEGGKMDPSSDFDWEEILDDEDREGLENLG